MKRAVSLLLAVLVACCGTLGASALEYTNPYKIRYETNGGYIEFYKQVSGQGVITLAIMNSEGLTGDLVIPAEVDSYPVTEIYYDFLDCDYGLEASNLASITFPETMKYLQEGYGQPYPDSLRKIVVPDGVNSFGRARFWYLEEAHLPASIRHIPEEALPWRNENFTIYAPTDSGAYRYAVEHGVNFVAEGDPPVLFTDISGHWGEQDILWSFRNQLLMGTSETAFSPEANLTRGMLAAVLYRLVNEPDKEVENPPEIRFDDVDVNAYYYKGACWLKFMGIADGEGNNRYRPNSNITREELAAMLRRFTMMVTEDKNANPTGKLDEFADGGKVQSWAKNAMSWAVGQGILKGDEKGRLNPQGLATRAEVAAILHRFELQRVY